ncbi:MAG: PH domain-containing protein [Sarcina sp.]
MKEYRLSKRYILKMIIVRLILLVLIDVAYIEFNGRINSRYHAILFIVIYSVNVILGAITFGMPFIEYIAYKYVLDDEAFELKYGVFFRKTIYIPRGNIKYIIVQKDPIDRILGISSLKLYTTAGNTSIKALSKSRLRELWGIMDVADVTDKGE